MCSAPELAGVLLWVLRLSILKGALSSQWLKNAVHSEFVRSLEISVIFQTNLQEL